MPSLRAKRTDTGPKQTQGSNRQSGQLVAFDTETTGLDFWHGARPFIVTTCQRDGTQINFEWDVDPLTRKVRTPVEDIEHIASLLEDEGEPVPVVGHNISFDIRAMEFAGLKNWKWSVTEDTQLIGHMLASHMSHGLTDMVAQYCDFSIHPWENRLEDAVKQARNWATRNRPAWKIARKEDDDLPSAKGGQIWRMDYWLPKAVVMDDDRMRDEHPDWLTVAVDYASVDSSSDLLLYDQLMLFIDKMRLWAIYKERKRLLQVIYRMEKRGVTLSSQRLRKLIFDYAVEAGKCAATLVDFAAEKHNYVLDLPKGAAPNNCLRSFVFDVMKLPVIERSAKTNEPSMNAKTLVAWQYGEHMLEDQDQLDWIKTLDAKRKRDTALTYMAGYQRFWIMIRGSHYVLHPNVNPTGTITLRSSSSNPNEQNISKKEGFNLRYAFGPLPGREWVSMDYENLELKIPAYESGEEKMIELFEKPNEAPYFGSYHLLNASIIYPDVFWPIANEKGRFKDDYKSTYYQWVKNGGFAIQYGAQKRKADATFRKAGAYDLLSKMLPKVQALKDKYVAFGNKHGYVETIPDKTVDPKRGYPMGLIKYGGKVNPTEPFSYHVQGTACWCKNKALVRCQDQLDEWREKDGFDGYIIMDVHDEIDFDLPAGTWVKQPWRVRRLKELMEMSGNDIGIPLTVSASLHTHNWAEESDLKLA